MVPCFRNEEQGSKEEREGRKEHEMKSAEATVPWGLSSKSTGKPLQGSVEAKDTVSLTLP